MHIAVKKIASISLILCHSLTAQNQPWAWTYRMVSSPEQVSVLQKKRELTFTKQQIPPFTQLIFSWNALRPAKGHFTFMVQVRERSTKTWDTWHTMSQWGSGVQRSFLSKNGVHSEFNHVRLELLQGKCADAVRIKVMATPDADCSVLDSFYVCTVNYHNFVTERNHSFKQLPSIHIGEVPLFSQMVLDHPAKEKICSPTSTSMLLSYLTEQTVCPKEFAEGAFDHGLGAYGSWPFNTAHAFEKMRGSMNFKVTRLNSFADLHTHLSRNIPVVVSVRGTLEQGAKTYQHGHLIVVVGWNAHTKKVICHDPAFDTIDKTYVEYDLTTFIDGWERSRRLAYIADWV